VKGWKWAGNLRINQHHRRSDLHHLDRLAAAVLLSAGRLVEIGLKKKA
jgi:hypothetical protein